jgi:hypothetical protein
MISNCPSYGRGGNLLNPYNSQIYGATDCHIELHHKEAVAVADK